MNRKAASWVLLGVMLGGCGMPPELEGAVDLEAAETDPAAEAQDGEEDGLAREESPIDEEGTLAALDQELGEDFFAPDPFEEPDACLDLDLCEEVGPPDVLDLAQATQEDGAVDPATGEPVEAPAPEVAAAEPAADKVEGEVEALTAGAKMMTLTYAGLHRHASASSALLDAAPHGGVEHNSLHPYRNPRGVIPPAQVMTLLDPDASHGFYKVRYQGVTGWVARRKLVAVNSRISPVAFAMRSGNRNAFFKHQIYRSRFNKDGPLSSGNCAPTSLAMAARVFGAEPMGLSVEESIHRVRATYDRGLHEGRGTTRAQIEAAARALHLNVRPLKTDLPPSRALTRINGQLAAGRVVVLAGIPGREGHGPTLYEQAFNRAYAAAIRNGARLKHSRYDFNRGHSIMVLGRDGNGRYVVGDPISEVGMLAITGAELKDFMARYTGARGTGNAVWK